MIREIAALEASGLSDHTRIEFRRGAGAYICGEESAMLESIEGKRGIPRHRPPYVAQVGLFGRPTLVNNIETLLWVPEILKNGADWFADQGVGDSKGLRSYSVSGRVNDPGVKLVPAGLTVQQLIDNHCGGMLEGHTFRAYLPGGASGGVLPASLNDLPLDFGQLETHGSFVGSHAVVILSDQDDMRAVSLNLMKFFEDESCGQCTPCRNGTEKAVKLMSGGKWGQRPARRSLSGDGRRVDLRARTSRPQSAAIGTEVFSGGILMTPQAVPTVQIDNDRVRVTEWRFAPGAETGIHTHEMDYVVVPGMTGQLRIISHDNTETITDLTVGVSYARQAGVCHNVINHNDFEFSFVEVELK